MENILLKSFILNNYLNDYQNHQTLNLFEEYFLSFAQY
jgi:hypothetical protein